MTGGRRLLMIAPYFPPRDRVGAARPHKLALELPRLGWLPRVVHLAAGGDPPGLDGVPCHPLGTLMDRTTTGGGSSLAPRRPGPRLLDRVDDHLPVDGWLAPLLWSARSVVRFAREVGVDAVWSTADPWSSHLLAARVVEQLRVPWVADFRDPWTLCKVRNVRRPLWIRAIDRRAESFVLSRVDRIVFTADRTRSVYADAYPRYAGRMRVVTNGYAGPVVPFSNQPRNGAQVILRFFGRFRPLSSAARIIAVLSELKRLDPEALAAIEVRSVGGLDDPDRRRAEAAGVADRFFSEDPVSREQRNERLASSDLLLLSVERGRDEILPAKLFDYLAGGRPVFALADSPEIAGILQQTGVGVAFGADAEVLAAGYLARAVRAARAGQPFAAGPARPEAIARWSSAEVARRTALVLDEVAGTEGPRARS